MYTFTATCCSNTVPLNQGEAVPGWYLLCKGGRLYILADNISLSSRNVGDIDTTDCTYSYLTIDCQGQEATANCVLYLPKKNKMSGLTLKLDKVDFFPWALLPSFILALFSSFFCPITKKLKIPQSTDTAHWKAKDLSFLIITVWFLWNLQFTSYRPRYPKNKWIVNGDCIVHI